MLRKFCDQNFLPCAIHIGVDADIRPGFAIVGTGANPVTPFVVYTTPRTVNGQVLPVGVYMENVAIGRAQITNVLESDNYAQDALGQPTAGMRLNFNTGRIKTANAVISRNIIAATGQIDPGVIAINQAAVEHHVDHIIPLQGRCPLTKERNVCGLSADYMCRGICGRFRPAKTGGKAMASTAIGDLRI